MDMEFDGATEREAVQKAIDELKISDFEYEVLSQTKKGIFKKPCVRIRVLLENGSESISRKPGRQDDWDDDDDEVFTPALSSEPESEIEKDMASFVSGLSERMGVRFTPQIVSRGNKGKVNVNLKTDEGSYVIGYKGERLDAMQIITSAYILSKHSDESGSEAVRFVLDVDGYRQERMRKVLKDSIFQAKKVKSGGKPIFLDPLNSYERRAVHKAIGDMGGLVTESYGNGLLKRIKITRA